MVTGVQTCALPISNNPCNVVSATVNGLCSLQSAEQVAAKRGKTVKEILG